jgi:hypothetical protein
VDIINNIKNAFTALGGKQQVTKNSVDPNAFLKYGSRKMPSTWSTPDIKDEDFYTGYGFAVINKRANRSVVLGKKFLFTEATESIEKEANIKNEVITHPYLSLIRESLEFSERDFWYDISTYLDLEGIYYLMAVRTVTGSGKVGNIQRFSLLNPYWVKPIVNSKGELGGYVENHPVKGNRDIPKEMIIPIKLLNPFNPERPYSLADAARDSQFTLKQANDFARESIDGNLNAPGILSSAIELPDDQFDNFVARIKSHSRGEPLFGNGAGTISWTDMQTDLDKAALDKINSINRDVLLAVSGLSKTGVGVEESGTGREVSRTQKDDFTENAIMPQIENIIDQLNLDYRRYYEPQYKSNGYTITLDNPLETNRDAEQADVDIRDSQFALMQSLISKGYSIEIASKYAKGKIDITALGEPTEEIAPVVDPLAPKDPAADTPPADTPPADTKKPEKKVEPKASLSEELNEYEGYPVPLAQYLDEHADQIRPFSEEKSSIYTHQLDPKTVRIQSVEENDGMIWGVVDNGHVLLAHFNDNADKTAILAKLNKRYKNQLVAVKKKINNDLDHDCDHDIADVVKNAAPFDKQETIDQNTNELNSAARAAEDRLFNWYEEQITAGTLPATTPLDDFINQLTLPFAVFFTVMFPIYASYRMQKTADDLNIKDEVPVISVTEELKAQINQFAKREADSHIHTIDNDIRAALAVIRSKTSDPLAQREMFQIAFKQIQDRRSIALANNAAARIFNLSQYEADLQFLTRAGLINQAYKVMFSLTGAPCSICSKVIAATNTKPVPFTSAFVEFGEEITGSDGKHQKFDFETIIAGNVHPNCHCAYKLVMADEIA